MRAGLTGVHYYICRCRLVLAVPWSVMRAGLTGVRVRYYICKCRLVLAVPWSVMRAGLTGVRVCLADCGPWG